MRHRTGSPTRPAGHVPSASSVKHVRAHKTPPFVVRLATAGMPRILGNCVPRWMSTRCGWSRGSMMVRMKLLMRQGCACSWASASWRLPRTFRARLLRFALELVNAGQNRVGDGRPSRRSGIRRVRPELDLGRCARARGAGARSGGTSAVVGDRGAAGVGTTALDATRMLDAVLLSLMGHADFA